MSMWFSLIKRKILRIYKLIQRIFEVISVILILEISKNKLIMTPGIEEFIRIFFIDKGLVSKFSV